MEWFLSGILVIGSYKIVEAFIDVKKKRELAEHIVGCEDIDRVMIYDGEVYLKYLNAKEYKQFRKRVKQHGRQTKISR